MIVVICGPPQAGKDYITDKLMSYLAMFDRATSYASVYKIREPRTTDGKHVKCIASLDQVDVQQEDRVDDTLFGNQTIIYDKKEIKQKLECGEIVFIATVSPQLAKKVKAEFGKQCYSVFHHIAGIVVCGKFVGVLFTGEMEIFDVVTEFKVVATVSGGHLVDRVGLIAAEDADDEFSIADIAIPEPFDIYIAVAVLLGDHILEFTTFFNGVGFADDQIFADILGLGNTVNIVGGEVGLFGNTVDTDHSDPVVFTDLVTFIGDGTNRQNRLGIIL